MAKRVVNDGYSWLMMVYDYGNPPYFNPLNHIKPIKPPYFNPLNHIKPIKPPY